MAGLPAENGLYACFFSAVMYFLFGTSRQLSIGTYGIIALMVNGYLIELEGKLYPMSAPGDAKNLPKAQQLAEQSIATVVSQVTSDSEVVQAHRVGSSWLDHVRLFNNYRLLDTEFLSQDSNEAKAMIATSFAFYVGIFQVTNKIEQ